MCPVSFPVAVPCAKHGRFRSSSVATVAYVSFSAAIGVIYSEPSCRREISSAISLSLFLSFSLSLSAVLGDRRRRSPLQTSMASWGQIDFRLIGGSFRPFTPSPGRDQIQRVIRGGTRQSVS